ncbi:MAG: hypothetical protein WD770_11710 [Actinomycetota bacterium]
MAGIALLATLVAVAGAAFLFMNASGRVDEQRSLARTLRGQIASMADKVEAAEERADDVNKTNVELKGGFKQCQRALELTSEIFETAFAAGASPTDEQMAELEGMADQADKAAVICMGKQLDLIDTY